MKLTVLLLIANCIILLICVADMLYGKSSLSVLLSLKDDSDRVKRRVIELKEENAILQKKYFELYQLDPNIK